MIISSGRKNVAAFKTAGLDVTLNYSLDVSPQIGSFNLRINGNYLDKLTFVPTPGADVEDSRLLTNAPKFSGTLDLTWSLGAVTVNYGLNYFSKTRRYTVDQITANPDISDPKYFFYREKYEHDLQASFQVANKFNFYLGVNNLTNQVGDVASVSYPYGFQGRTFYAGAKISLDDLF